MAIRNPILAALDARVSADMRRWKLRAQLEAESENELLMGVTIAAVHRSSGEYGHIVSLTLSNGTELRPAGDDSGEGWITVYEPRNP